MDGFRSMLSPACASNAAYHVQLLSTVKAATMPFQSQNHVELPSPFSTHPRPTTESDTIGTSTELMNSTLSSTMKRLLHCNANKANKLPEVSFQAVGDLRACLRNQTFHQGGVLEEIGGSHVTSRDPAGV